MGGINPPRPRHFLGLESNLLEGQRLHPLVTLSQKHTRALFKVAIDFFSAHVAIEDAVLSEGQGIVDITSLKKAESDLSLIVEEIEAAQQNIAAHKKGIQEEDSWFAAYFQHQEQSFTTLKKLAQDLFALLQRQEVIDAANALQLQESLWNNNVNAEIRRQSIAFETELIQALQHHNSIVDEMNK
jgi:hypothetical protein